MFRKVVLSFIFTLGLSGFAFAQATSNSIPQEKKVPIAGQIQILKKPQAQYTNTARKNRVQGMIVLRVVFLASGEIGDVTLLEEKLNGSNLEFNGLAKQAIKAAKKIKFIPAAENGQPATVTRTVSYGFTIY
jgi:TonB family protein